MNSFNENQQTQTLTAEYEQLVLHTFIAWYVIENPTLHDASVHTNIVARDAINRLTRTEVLTLLQEHPEWVQQKLETDTKERFDITIAEITRRQCVKHLETVIQEQGFKAIFASLTEAH